MKCLHICNFMQLGCFYIHNYLIIHSFLISRSVVSTDLVLGPTIIPGKKCFMRRVRDPPKMVL